MDNRPVGIFDSGVGGLTVGYEVIRLLPNEDIIFFGDTGRNPYGTRPMQEISDFSVQIGRFLVSKDVKAIVIACNTATIGGYAAMAKEFSVPIIGVVNASVDYAVKITKNKVIGVIATNFSINSQAFHNGIKAHDSAMDVIGVGCPKLVQLAEKSIFDGPEVDAALDEYLKDIKAKKADVLILGCTHFPFFRDKIQAYLGKGVTLVDPSEKVAASLKEVLESKNELGLHEMPTRIFYSSKQNDTLFAKTCNELLGAGQRCEYVDITKY